MSREVSFYIDKEFWSPKHKLWKTYNVIAPKLPSATDQFPSTVSCESASRWVESNVNKPANLKAMELPHNEQLIQSLTLFFKNLKTDKIILSHFEKESDKTKKEKELARLKAKKDKNRDDDTDETTLPACQIIFGPKGSGKTVLVEKYVYEIGKQLTLHSNVLDKFYFYYNIASPAITMQELRAMYKELTIFCEYHKNSNIPVNYRIVIIDNLDNLTPSFQMGVKQFVEKFEDKIKWIFICTQPLKLIQFIQLKSLSMRMYSISEYDCLKIVLDLCHRNRIGFERIGIHCLFKLLFKPPQPHVNPPDSKSKDKIQQKPHLPIHPPQVHKKQQPSQQPQQQQSSLLLAPDQVNGYDHPPVECSLTQVIDVIQKVFFHYHFISEENVLRLLAPASVLMTPYVAPFAFYPDGTTSNDLVIKKEVKPTRLRATTKAGIPVFSKRTSSDGATASTMDATATLPLASTETLQAACNGTSPSVGIKETRATAGDATATMTVTVTACTLNTADTSALSTTEKLKNTATDTDKTDSSTQNKYTVSYQTIRASAAVDPTRRCPLCTLIPPCQHINKFQLADIGMAIRSKLLSLQPSFNYMPVPESEPAEAESMKPTGTSYSGLETYTKPYAKLNAKTFNIQIFKSSTSDSPQTIAPGKTPKRGAVHDKKIPVKIKNCPEFIHFGRCSIFNNYQYCPYIHPADFHKVVEYPAKRCDTCTLKLPCFHCPYSFLQKELRELCERIESKRVLLERLIDMAQTEVTLLTTDTNTIPFSGPNKGGSSILLTSTDDISLYKTANKGINHNQSKGNKLTNQRPATSAASTATASAPSDKGKTKRQLAAEAEAEYLHKKEMYLEALKHIHSNCIVVTNLKYLDEVREWNSLTRSVLAEDFSSKLEYVSYLFVDLLKSKIIREPKRNEVAQAVEAASAGAAIAATDQEEDVDVDDENESSEVSTAADGTNTEDDNNTASDHFDPWATPDNPVTLSACNGDD